MKSISTFIIGLSITVLMLLDAGLGEANPDRVGTLQLTDEISRSKVAFGVVEKEIARGLNLGVLAEQDYRKLRGPVLLKIQTAIHSQLRQRFGRIVNAVDFGVSSDSGSPSQSPSTNQGDKPVLHEKASEIIRDFIAQKHISVIIIADAPIGSGELSVVRGLGGQVRSTYDIINGACVAISVKNLGALIRRPFVTEVWPNSKAHLEWSRLQQIGADRVHTPRPTGLGVTGEGVVVGVVDDGIDSSHPEFENRLQDARGIVGGFRDTEDLKENDDYHGTHVAGIIGAAADDGNTMTGVAPDVEFLDARYATPLLAIDDSILYNDRPTYGDVIDATGWAAQIDTSKIPLPLELSLLRRWFSRANQKADVINMSLGFDPWDYGLDGNDPLSKLIDQVVSNGTVVIKSAGNEAARRASGDFTLFQNRRVIGGTHDFETNFDLVKFRVTLIWDNETNDLDLAVLDGGTEICASRNHSGFGFWNKVWKDKTKYGGKLYEQVECSVPVAGGLYTVQVEGHKGQGKQAYELWIEGIEAIGSSPRRALEFTALSRDPRHTVSVPGYSKKAITVGNVDYSNTLQPSSSQGPSTALIKPEVVAPGSAICSTVLYGSYKRYGGTSMAAPHVAGVAALILDAVGKNSKGKWNFSPDEVKSAIVRGAERGIGGISNMPDSEYGAGLVKADNIIFGGAVPSRGKLRFKITPRLLRSRFRGYVLNAENAHPSANPISLTAAISWKDKSHNLDLLLLQANGNRAGVARESGQDYEKISGRFTPTPGSIYYLDVINRSKAPVTFTGASTHPIKSLLAPDESNIHIEALDVTCDGVVNVLDLLAVAQMFNRNGVKGEDVDSDGDVDLDDMELIAVELEGAAGAPAAPTLSRVTIETVEQWLSKAKRMQHTDPTFLRGLAILEQLLALFVPEETALLPNYPNPFNPETWIPYQLAEPADVTVTLYAADGQLVRTLALGHRAAGIYHSRSRAAYWDGRNELGERVASGLYFFTFTAGDFTATRKMLIRK